MGTHRIFQDRYPLANETCTICMPQLFKPAALLFDRIHISPGNYPISSFQKAIEEIPEEVTFGIREIDEQHSQIVRDLVVKELLKKTDLSKKWDVSKPSITESSKVKG